MPPACSNRCGGLACPGGVPCPSKRDITHKCVCCLEVHRIRFGDSSAALPRRPHERAHTPPPHELTRIAVAGDPSPDEARAAPPTFAHPCQLPHSARDAEPHHYPHAHAQAHGPPTRRARAAPTGQRHRAHVQRRDTPPSGHTPHVQRRYTDASRTPSPAPRLPAPRPADRGARDSGGCLQGPHVRPDRGR